MVDWVVGLNVRQYWFIVGARANHTKRKTEIMGRSLLDAEYPTALLQSAHVVEAIIFVQECICLGLLFDY